MATIVFKNGQTSVILRVFIPDKTSVFGEGKTGLAYNSSGLIVSTIADNEASATNYTEAGGTIETITTLGTFAAPTATKCRFKEVDATYQPGLYELQIADARWAVSGARYVDVCLPGVAGLGTAPHQVRVQLTAVDPQDAVRFGLSALPNVAAGASGGLPVLAGKLLNYFRLLVRKDAAIATDAATELTELNADGGSGAGSFDSTTDSEQGIRDNMATMSGGIISADVVKVNGDADAAALLGLAATTKIAAVVDDPGGNATETRFITTLTAADDDAYARHILIVRPGEADQNMSAVKSYNASTKELTLYYPLPGGAPADSDALLLIPSGG